MSEACSALRLFALEDATLASLLGDRISPSTVHQSDTVPAVTYQTISGTNDEALDGDVGHQNDRIQFDVYADDASLAHSIARRLRSVLLDAYGSLDTAVATEEVPVPPAIVVTGMATAGGIRDLSAESPIDGGADWQYRASFDLFCSFNPSA